jgi:hypothetical protein
MHDEPIGMRDPGHDGIDPSEANKIIVETTSSRRRRTQ